jgi:hypothetical protein
MKALQDLMYVMYSLVQKMVNGVGAFTVQPYTEVNIKRGVQYEVSGVFSLAAGASVDLVYISGGKPCILKGKELNFTCEEITASLYEAPTYTGGTAVPVYNLTRINPVPKESEVLGGVTVTDVGTKIAADRVFLGSTASGNRVASSSGVEGLERVFKPNTVHLERITNTSAAACKVSVYLTWYEGDIDYGSS